MGGYVKHFEAIFRFFSNFSKNFVASPPLNPLNLPFLCQKCYKVADSSPAPPSKCFLIGFLCPRHFLKPKQPIYTKKSNNVAKK